MPAMLPFLATLILITQVVIPLIAFTTQDDLPNPVTQSALGYATGFNDFEFAELQNNVLGSTTHSDYGANAPDYFYITIPKLEIENALVETNAETLQPDNALGHYKGSAFPGEVGNSFIYGHSVIPIFYNPDNYKTIFSTLNKLEVGDEYYVTYNNRRYKYEVENKETLWPEEVFPLADIKPSYMNESTMVLMTCSPPGTKLKRLVVEATMVN